MAVVFELVINYGDDRAAAETAGRVVAAHPPLAAGPHQVPLHDPLMGTVHDATGRPYVEMSVSAARVGSGNGQDGTRPRLLLTAAELSELGSGLYALLAKLTGYRAARVGWDPEDYLDLATLEQEGAEEIAAGALHGLVLAADLDLGLPMDGFVPFVDGFVWIPYEGERPSNLTVDADL